MRRAIVLALALMAPTLFAAASRAEQPEPLLVLEQLADADADDAPLQWARARARLEAGRPAEAAEAFSSFRKRWPARRPEAAREHGHALLLAGRTEEAAEVLAEAGRVRPDDAVAQLYLGLALLRLGDAGAANAALARASALSPELAEGTALLRGTAALRDGREREGEDILRRLAQGGDEALERRVAGVVLARHVRRERPRVQLFAYGGIEHDSNVTLDSGLDLPGLPSDQRDWVAVYGGGVSVDVWRGERAQLSLGYRFDQSDHFELGRFDLQSHQAWASGSLRLSPRLWLRLDGRGYTSRLDKERYLDLWSASPALWIDFGRRFGSLRIFGLLEQQSYDQRPLLASLERDGWRYGGGLEQLVPIPALGPEAWFTLGGRFVRTETQGKRDLFGLGPAFDGDRYELRMRLMLPLAFGFRFEGSAIAAGERYDHRNVIDFLTDGGVGDLTPSRRQDAVIDFRTALVRPIGRFVDLELALRITYRFSNVDVYAYERRVAGVYLRVHGP